MVKTLDWLEDLANSTQSTEDDSSIMQGMLRQMRFPKAVVVCGVVYVNGRGRPVSIHSMAKMILDQYKEGIKA